MSSEYEHREVDENLVRLNGGQEEEKKELLEEDIMSFEGKPRQQYFPAIIELKINPFTGARLNGKKLLQFR